MSAQEWLDRTQEITEKATAGPWEIDMEDQTVRTRTRVIMFDASWATPLEWEREDCHDARFIAHARTALPQAVATLRAVTDLHQPRSTVARSASGHLVDAPGPCTACDWGWPCPTITTITETLGEP